MSIDSQSTMVDYEAEIKKLEDELKKTQYNKATEHHFGVVKARIAKLRELQEKRSGIGKRGGGWAVRKSGDATVVLLGFPSVGKSTLLNALTGAQSKTGAYAFTTLDAVPGVMKYKHAKIQIIDVPGIVQGAAAGKGRGKEVLALVRTADLILVLIDPFHPEQQRAILKEAYDAKIRLNKEKPDVKIAKRGTGGLDIHTTVQLDVDRDTLQAICKEFKLQNADVVIRTPVDIDEFIDSIEGNRSYVKGITVIVKSDLISHKQRQELKKEAKPDTFISAMTGEGVEELRKKIYDKLKFIRVFMKEVNKKPDLEEPMILQEGATLRDVCKHVHRDYVKKFKYARLWGPSAKFDGQMVRSLDRHVRDGDVVELHAS